MRLIFFSIVMLAATSVTAQQSLPDYAGTYYCKITASAGLRLNRSNNEWEGAVFGTTNEVYKIVLTNTGMAHDTRYYGTQPIYRMNVSELGEEPSLIDCRPTNRINPEDPTQMVLAKTGNTWCRLRGWEYRVNFLTKRIQITFDGGYMDPEGKDTDTPYLSVGKCDKIG